MVLHRRGEQEFVIVTSGERVAQGLFDRQAGKAGVERYVGSDQFGAQACACR
jgi:hypothetical protein